MYMDALNISLNGIQKSYAKPVLTSINLEITNESYIAIVGKSGSGKSTLLNILGLVESFDDGAYLFNGVSIRNSHDYSKLRLEKIGFIFQNYNLIPTLSCKENIMLPTLYSNKETMDFNEIVDLLKIGHLLNTPVNVLSGGEKQRVAIARALILNPQLILADEPTGNLDEENKNTVLELLKKEHFKGRAVVLITHDYSVAKKMDCIYELEGGQLHEKA